MGKEEVIGKRYFIILVLLIFSWNSMAQTGKNGVVAFENKAQIVKWSNDQFFGGVQDSVTYSIHELDVFFLIGSFTSGMPSLTVFVFVKGENKKLWYHICTRTSFSKKLEVLFDEREQQFTIKSFEGRTLLTLPLEGVRLGS